jgi:hypothetical protein
MSNRNFVLRASKWLSDTVLEPNPCQRQAPQKKATLLKHCSKKYSFSKNTVAFPSLEIINQVNLKKSYMVEVKR